MKKTILTVTAAAAALLFSSCANPYGPGASNSQRDATTGALLGAGLGGIIGHQSGRALEGAAVGAAVGGVGGYAVGQNKDNHYYRR